MSQGAAIAAAVGAAIASAFALVVFLIKRGWKGATQDIVNEHEEKRTQDIIEKLRSELRKDVQEAMASFIQDNNSSHKKLHERIDDVEDLYHKMDKETGISIAETRSRQEAYQKDVDEVRNRLAGMDAKIDSVLKWIAQNK